MQTNDDALHFSKLKNIGDSPMHYLYFEDFGREDTDDFITGRAVHKGFLLGIMPTCWEGRRVGKDYKLAVEANGGDGLLTETMRDNAMHMIDSLLKSRKALDVMLHAPFRECERIWTRRGIKCAGRVDAYGKDVLVELKTDKDGNPRGFQWRGKCLGYREQLAWYDVGLGTKPDPFEPKWRESYTIVVGKKAPWPVSIHKVSPLAMQKAHSRVEEWLDLYQECQRSGNWPGWDDRIRDWDADIERVEDDDE
jgi:hypothetical protein